MKANRAADKSVSISCLFPPSFVGRLAQIRTMDASRRETSIHKKSPVLTTRDEIFRGTTLFPASPPLSAALQTPLMDVTCPSVPPYPAHGRFQEDSSGVNIKMYPNPRKLSAGDFLSLLENTSLYAPSSLFSIISALYSIATFPKSQPSFTKGVGKKI